MSVGQGGAEIVFETSLDARLMSSWLHAGEIAVQDLSANEIGFEERTALLHQLAIFLGEACPMGSFGREKNLRRCVLEAFD